MNSIYSVTGNYSTNNFFSSMFGTSSSNSSYSPLSSMTSLFSDYSMIKNGTYYKLAKAYYNKQNSGTTTGTTKYGELSADAKAEKTALTSAKGNASSLKTAADALMTTGKNSVFNQKDVTDAETGATKKEYDVDAIYNAVKNYVDSYNNVVENTIDCDTVSVLRKALSMVNNTKANENLLSKIGITIGEDNTLKIDEEKFKSADMTIVKSLFNGQNSLSDRIGQRAEDIVNLSSNAIKSIGNNTYTSSGYYSSSASSVGSFYDSTL